MVGNVTGKDDLLDEHWTGDFVALPPSDLAQLGSSAVTVAELCAEEETLLPPKLRTKLLARARAFAAVARHAQHMRLDLLPEELRFTIGSEWRSTAAALAIVL